MLLEGDSKDVGDVLDISGCRHLKSRAEEYWQYLTVLEPQESKLRHHLYSSLRVPGSSTTSVFLASSSSSLSYSFFAWRPPLHMCLHLDADFNCVEEKQYIRKIKVVTPYWCLWFLRNIDLASFCPSLPFHLTSIDTSINKDRITLKWERRERKGKDLFRLVGLCKGCCFQPFLQLHPVM